jgi:hypothetical protein
MDVTLANLKGKDAGSKERRYMRDPSHATRILLNIFVLPLLLPPASQRLVKLNECQALVELGLHQAEFR